jgi:histidyl-tRNA synthetase
MTEQKQFRAIKGTRDILPPDSSLWNWFETTARRVMESYGFREIRLPIFEQTELFARSVGADTDIVSKEMYTLASYGAGNLVGSNTIARAGSGDGSAWESISLRPEATASVVRAYIEHGMHVQPGNVKLYYMGPMFRRERPQKGRYRQFYQIGAEVLTAAAPGRTEETEKDRAATAAVDAEVIEMLMHLFDAAGLTACTLHINSIGCKDCRPKYVAELRAALEKVRDKLGPDSQRRIATNPLRVLDSKLPEEQAIIETLPRITDCLCDACQAQYAAVKHDLAHNRGLQFEENWRLVRGLDYYMRTTFEIVAPGLGAQNAVCGGGRYDGLVRMLGGPDTKGIGFAIGTDRVILSLQQTGKVKGAQLGLGVDVYVAWMGAAAQLHAIRIARKLRDAGMSVEVPAEEMKFKKSVGLAGKLGARYALIIGENEVASGRYALKELATAQQRSLTEGEIVEFLKGVKEVAK